MTRTRGWRFAHGIACALAFAGLALYTPVPGFAQPGQQTPPTTPTTLADIREVPVPGGGTRLVLRFVNGGLPQYKIFGQGTSSVSIILFDTLKAAAVPPNIPETATGGGYVIGGSVTNSGSSVVADLELQGTPSVKVFAGQGQTLNVDVLPSGAAAVPLRSAATPTPVTGGELHEIIRLKYADLSEVVGLLVPGQTIPSNDTFTPQAGAGNFGASGGLGGFGGGPSFTPSTPGFNQGVAQQINTNVSIDRRLNAVILTGPPDLVASYKALIDEIDIPLASVMLETQIVELTDSGAVQAGIDFGEVSGVIGSASLAIRTTSGTPASSLGSVNLQAAVYAQIQKGNGKLLAQPRILALDGTQASIITGNALPIVTSIAVSGVNAVQQQVQYVNVGVNLQIQPRVASDGYVTVHVYSAVSSVTGFSQTYPQIAQRTAYTSAIVKDGESFVIGGLLEKSEINSLSKIPGLGDLPLVGAFFRVRNNTSSSDNLYIIVTPRVIRREPAPSASPTPPSSWPALRTPPTSLTPPTPVLPPSLTPSPPATSGNS